MLGNFLRLGSITVLSRIAGFLRDLTIAFFLGATKLADAYFIGTRLVVSLRAIFSDNNVEVGLVTKFQEIAAKTNRKTALAFAYQIFGIFAAIGLAMVVVLEGFAPFLIAALAPGIVGSDTFGYAVDVLRLSAPFVLFHLLIMWQSGMLIVEEKFSAFGFVSVGLNLCFLVTALVLYITGAEPLDALYYFGATYFYASVLLFLLMAMVVARRGVRSFRIVKINWGSSNIRAFLKRFFVTSSMAVLMTLSGLVTVFLASFLETGAISHLFYAERMFQLPVGILGSVVAVVLLPSLSRDALINQTQAAKNQNHSVLYIWLLALPAMAGMFLLAEPIMEVLFVRGAFTVADAVSSAMALKVFSFATLNICLLKIANTMAFSRGDFKIPFRMVVLVTFLDIATGAMLLPSIGYLALATKTVVASTVGVVVFFWILHKRRHFVITKELLGNLAKVVVASLLMGVVVYLLQGLLPIEGCHFLPKLINLALIITAGLGFYFGALMALRLVTIKDVKRFLYG